MKTVFSENNVVVGIVAVFQDGAVATPADDAHEVDVVPGNNPVQCGWNRSVDGQGNVSFTPPDTGA